MITHTHTRTIRTLCKHTAACELGPRLLQTKTNRTRCSDWHRDMVTPSSQSQSWLSLPPHPHLHLHLQQQQRSILPPSLPVSADPGAAAAAAPASGRSPCRMSLDGRHAEQLGQLAQRNTSLRDFSNSSYFYPHSSLLLDFIAAKRSGAQTTAPPHWSVAELETSRSQSQRFQYSTCVLFLNTKKENEKHTVEKAVQQSVRTQTAGHQGTKWLLFRK